MKYFLSSPFIGDYSFLSALSGDKVKEVKSIDKADIVVFTGGADVSPYLYKHAKAVSTYPSPVRDQREINIYNLARKLNLPIFGICRGLQFINVMSGGTLIQHADNHVSGRHAVLDLLSNENFKVNSLHHQIIVPPKMGCLILANVNPGLSYRYIYGKTPVYLDAGASGLQEIEAAYYPEINALGVQWHPELAFPNSDSVLLAETYINKYLGKRT